MVMCSHASKFYKGIKRVYTGKSYPTVCKGVMVTMRKYLKTNK